MVLFFWMTIHLFQGQIPIIHRIQLDSGKIWLAMLPMESWIRRRPKVPYNLNNSVILRIKFLSLQKLSLAISWTYGINYHNTPVLCSI